MAVVVPFHGTPEEAVDIARRLATLQLGPGDRVLIADNTEVEVTGRLELPGRVEALVTDVKRSAYAARNEAIEAVDQPWVLLLDADCHPRPDIVERFFDGPVGDRVGAISGGVGGLAGQPGFVPAYARSRHHLDQARLLESHVFRPMAVTANLLVRRSAWEEVGGFAELVASGADGDFCWRLQEAGWTLEHRAAAAAPHEHRSSVGDVLAKARRDGAANPWLARRWIGYPRRVGVLRQIVRAGGGVPVWLLRGRPRSAAFKAFDLLWVGVADLGGLRGNAAPRPLPPAARRTTVLTVEAPRPADPLLTGLPEDVRLEALRRPLVVQDWRVVRHRDLWLAEDDGPVDRLGALARLGMRRPLAVARSLMRDRRMTVLLAPAALRTAREGGAVAATPEADPAARALRALSGASATELPGP